MLCLKILYDIIKRGVSKMKALITGASSGLGREMAKVLSEKGYDIIAVARRNEKLVELKNIVKTNLEILCLDVTMHESIEIISTYLDETYIFINNAGFAVYGDLCSSDADNELKMLNTNIKAVHILTKLAAQKFVAKNSGYIMNVSSVAAFFSGPLLSSYYASKAYVYKLSIALYNELKFKKSKVNVSVLCPGPIRTEFEKTAKISFGIGNEKYAGFIIADKAIDKMLKGKCIIIPGILMKTAVIISRIFPEKFLGKLIYIIQNKFIKEQNN